MLTIKPCTYNWNNLLDNENGKFCNDCSSSIHDLTTLSKLQISQLLNSKKNICGKVFPNQLDDIKLYHPLKRFAFALLLAFGSSLFIISGQAQDTLQAIQQSIDSSIQEKSITFKGTIVDRETKEILPFCAIMVKNNDQTYGVNSDLDGNFKLIIPNPSKEITIMIKYVGYLEQHIIIAATDKRLIDLRSIELDSNFEPMIGIIIEDIPLIDKSPNAMRSTTFKREDIKRLPRN